VATRHWVVMISTIASSDHRIFCWILETAGLRPLSVEDARMLLTRAREAKEYLTFHGVAQINAHLNSGEQIDLTLTTEIFAEITQTLVAKTMQPVKKALRDAGLSVAEVKGVVMVGGATRMPQVQRAVGDFFRQDPLNNLDRSAEQSRSRQGRRHRSGQTGQPAGWQRPGRR